MLLLALDGWLLPLTAKTPAFAPLLKLPPRISAPVWPAPLFHDDLPPGSPEKRYVLLELRLGETAREIFSVSDSAAMSLTAR